MPFDPPPATHHNILHPEHLARVPETLRDGVSSLADALNRKISAAVDGGGTLPVHGLDAIGLAVILAAMDDDALTWTWDRLSWLADEARDTRLDLHALTQSYVEGVNLFREVDYAMDRLDALDSLPASLVTSVIGAAHHTSAYSPQAARTFLTDTVRAAWTACRTVGLGYYGVASIIPLSPGYMMDILDLAQRHDIAGMTTTQIRAVDPECTHALMGPIMAGRRRQLPPGEARFLGAEPDTGTVIIFDKEQVARLEAKRPREEFLAKLHDLQQAGAMFRLPYPWRDDMAAWISGAGTTEGEILITTPDGLTPIANTHAAERYVTPAFRGQGFGSELILVSERDPFLARISTGSGIYSGGGYASRVKAFQVLSDERFNRYTLDQEPEPRPLPSWSPHP